MEINGIEYKERPQKQFIGGRSFGKMMMMAQMFGGMSMPKQKDLGVNIVAEFRLIQEKKSLLSRADRDLVVHRFNRAYERVS
jgi:hypothetical protein